MFILDRQSLGITCPKITIPAYWMSHFATVLPGDLTNVATEFNSRSRSNSALGSYQSPKFSPSDLISVDV